MRHTKDRMKIIHEPSTHEIFYCLSEMPSYSKILASQSSDKPFIDFLLWLIEKGFYSDREDKIPIKKIASDFKSDAPKVTKWIKEIYEAIFTLNSDKPGLFQGDGVKLCMYIRNYDDRCSFHTSLSVLPREFESVNFPFVKAKVGTDRFWVKKVVHEIEKDSATVTLWLDGSTLNKYREFALDKALFQGHIHFMSVFDKPSFELDDKLRKIYRN